MEKDLPIVILLYDYEYQKLVEEVIANRGILKEMMNYVYCGAIELKRRNEQFIPKDSYETVQKLLETAYLKNLEDYFKDEDISIRGVNPARIFGKLTAGALSRSAVGFDDWMAGYNGDPAAEDFAVINKVNVERITMLIANVFAAIETVMDKRMNKKEGEMKWKEN